MEAREYPRAWRRGDAGCEVFSPVLLVIVGGMESCMNSLPPMALHELRCIKRA
jgi:hypothetical protein